jgi:hypothetical protein
MLLGKDEILGLPVSWLSPFAGSIRNLIGFYIFRPANGQTGQLAKPIIT